MKLRLSLLAPIVAALLSACTTVQNIPLDKADKPPLNSVALLKISESQFIRVHDFTGSGPVPLIGGAIGGLIQANIDQNRAEKLAQAINARGTKFGDVMVSRLQAELPKAGIQVEHLPDKAPKLATDGKSDDYSEIVTDKGGILNVWFGAMGFVNTAMLTTEFQPWVIVNVRLIDPASKATRYQKTFTVGYEARVQNAEFIPLDAKYRFGNFDDLMTRMDEITEVFSVTQALVAERVAADIR